MIDGMDDETSISIRGRVASFVRGEKNIRELAVKKQTVECPNHILHLHG